jgi:hypothetical protein
MQECLLTQKQLSQSHGSGHLLRGRLSNPHIKKRYYWMSGTELRAVSGAKETYSIVCWDLAPRTAPRLFQSLLKFSFLSYQFIGQLNLPYTQKFMGKF